MVELLSFFLWNFIFWNNSQYWHHFFFINKRELLILKKNYEPCQIFDKMEIDLRNNPVILMFTREII